MQEYNSGKYVLMDTDTGEVISIEPYGKYWEKVYTKPIAEYFEVASGGAAVRVLSHLIRIKNSDNLILSTMGEISAATGVTTKTVTSTFNALYAKCFLKKIRSGCYLLSPYVMRYGSDVKGAVILRMWEEN